MNKEKQAIVYMHIATFLFGMTAILGKLISLNEFNMVWHRMALASVVFMLVPSFWKKIKIVPNKTIGIYLLNGIVVALHWLTFYGSIKVNNSASLTLACFGSVSIFAAFIEPLVFKVRVKKSEIALGLIVLVGLVFIAKANPDDTFSLSSNYVQAIILALISAFLAVVFTVVNKRFIADYSPSVLTWAQMLGGTIFLSIIMPFIVSTGVSFVFIPSAIDTFWMIVLVVLCTNIAFSMEMKALKNMSAFASTIILNLEPVYGIIVAIFVFKENENLNAWFYAGAVVVIASIFIHAFYEKKLKARKLQ